MTNLTRAWVQRTIDWVFFIPFCGALLLAIRLLVRYSVENESELKRQYRELTDQTSPPLIVCSNHMTYIDSIVLHYAFGNHWWYWFHFRRLMWNLPASDYRSNPFFALVCFLSKCIFINRTGSKGHKDQVITLARDLLERGETLTVFVEGRRTRIGRFDDRKLAYGVGKIIRGLPACRVLCCYLRAPGQREAVPLPPKGAKFRLYTELLHFETPAGRPPEMVARVTTQIAETIKRLESRYVAETGETLPPMPEGPPRPAKGDVQP